MTFPQTIVDKEYSKGHFSHLKSFDFSGPPGPTGLPGFDGRVGLTGDPVSRTLFRISQAHLTVSGI